MNDGKVENAQLPYTIFLELEWKVERAERWKKEQVGMQPHIIMAKFDYLTVRVDAQVK